MKWTRWGAVCALGTVAVATAAAPALAQQGPLTAVARMATSDGAAAGRVELISLEGFFDEGEASESGSAAAEFGGGGLTGRLGGQPRDLVVVLARLRGLPPGFHGFHVHETGRCDGPSFASAGGHFDRAGATHPDHAGDMPVVDVNADGTAIAGFFTDRFSVRHLFDADGSAIVVHAAPDNYANIPTDRYDPDPDAITRATGDAGAPIACGIVSRGQPTDFAEDAPPAATAVIQRRDGSDAGFAAFAPFAGKVLGIAFLQRIPAGFHGLHLHETGRCDRPSFESAGGHFNPTGATHGGHAGDLPVAYVTGTRFGIAAFATDRFRIRDLADADGTAIVVHANPDNYANIPTDRYDPDPDAITLATGDAGARIACGVVRRLVRCTISVSPGRFRAGERAVLRARVRSGGRPLREGLVFARGPGFVTAAPTNARGVARFAVTPTRRGRVRLQVERGLETLGCATSRPVVGGGGPALTGRS